MGVFDYRGLSVLCYSFIFGISEIILWSDHTPSEFFLGLNPSVACDSSSPLGYCLILWESLWFLVCRELSSHSFSEHREDELEIGHMIPEIGFGFCREIFVLLVLTRSHPECRTRYLGGEYGIVSLLGDTSLTPLIGEVLPDSDPTQSLVDPVSWISLLLVERLHPLLCELRILYLLYPLVSDLSQPLTEWFGSR